MSEKFIAMVIEDDAQQAEIFSQAIKMAGFEVETVLDGQAALDRLAEITPQIIVLDLNLPHVSGDKILAHIRQDERLAQARVIIATANPRMADPVQDDSDIMLIKPISFTQLRDLAERIKQTL
jgi:two-component system cell cycle response regulator DivK